MSAFVVTERCKDNTHYRSNVWTHFLYCRYRWHQKYEHDKSSYAPKTYKVTLDKIWHVVVLNNWNIKLGWVISLLWFPLNPHLFMQSLMLSVGNCNVNHHWKEWKKIEFNLIQTLSTAFCLLLADVGSGAEGKFTLSLQKVTRQLRNGVI